MARDSRIFMNQDMDIGVASRAPKKILGMTSPLPLTEPDS